MAQFIISSVSFRSDIDLNTDSSNIEATSAPTSAPTPDPPSDPTSGSTSIDSDINSDIDIGSDMAVEACWVIAMRLYYASCILVCCLFLGKIVELGCSNAYYGFSAIWIAPKMAFWGYEQLEQLWASTSSMYEAVCIGGDSPLCKAFANLFDMVNLGQSLNDVKIRDMHGEVVLYDYWASQYKIYIVVTRSQFDSAVWTPTISCWQWLQDARTAASDFQIIQIKHMKSSWSSKNELENTTLELRGKSRTQLQFFIQFANDVYGTESIRLRSSVPRTLDAGLTDSLLVASS